MLKHFRVVLFLASVISVSMGCDNSSPNSTTAVPGMKPRPVPSFWGPPTEVHEHYSAADAVAQRKAMLTAMRDTTPMPPPDPRDDEFGKITRRIHNGDDDGAIELLEAHPEWIQYCNANWGSLLSVAAGAGRVPITTYLLDHGANPNALSYWNQSPLEACLGNGKLAENCRKAGLDVEQHRVDITFELLLARGANPHTPKSTFSHAMTENGLTSGNDLLEFGIQLQQSRNWHGVQRSGMLASLRAYRDLPVDAMLPLNADSLYLRRDVTDLEQSVAQFSSLQQSGGKTQPALTRNSQPTSLWKAADGRDLPVLSQPGE